MSAFISEELKFKSYLLSRWEPNNDIGVMECCIFPFQKNLSNHLHLDFFVDFDINTPNPSFYELYNEKDKTIFRCWNGG